MLIYVGILSITSLLIVNTVISFSRSYKDVVALRIVDNSAMDALERITRDIRGATSIDTGNSTFNSSPGVLTLVKTTNGVSTTTKYYIQNGIIKADVNGTYFGPVTLSSASVTSLIFRKIDSANSSAIKIDMTITGTSGQSSKTKNYYVTTVMKII